MSSKSLPTMCDLLLREGLLNRLQWMQSLFCLGPGHTQGAREMILALILILILIPSPILVPIPIHAGLLNRLQWMQSLLPLGPGHTACLSSPLSFVDHLTSALAALLYGARLVVPAQGMLAAHPASLAGIIEVRICPCSAALYNGCPVQHASWHALKVF